MAGKARSDNKDAGVTGKRYYGRMLETRRIAESGADPVI